MANPTPKVTSTRLQLPLGVAGTEPTTAPTGSLAYATDTELVRVKTDAAWIDVGAGGGGTVTEIDAGDGIVVTDPTGPVVTVEVDPAVLADIDGKLDEDFASYANKATPVVADRIAINDSAAAFAPKYATVSALPLLKSDVTSYSSKATPVSADLIWLADSAASNAVKRATLGSLPANPATQLQESGGPTTLTIGAVSDGQVLVRSGSTIIGSSGVGVTTAGSILVASTTSLGSRLDVSLSANVGHIVEWFLAPQFMSNGTSDMFLQPFSASTATLTPCTVFTDIIGPTNDITSVRYTASSWVNSTTYSVAQKSMSSANNYTYRVRLMVRPSVAITVRPIIQLNAAATTYLSGCSVTVRSGLTMT